MGMYRTLDGHINLAASGGRLWEAFCGELESAEWLTDVRFASARARKANRSALNRLIEERLKMDTSFNWVTRLNSVGVPCGPVNGVADAFADPQVEHLGMAVDTEHPDAGQIQIIRNATNIDGVSNDIRRPSPRKGEHAHEILSSFGFDEQGISELYENGAVLKNESC
jgi:formyl-CoA transferase